MSPLSPLLRSLLQLLVVVTCPSSSCSGLGVSRFCIFIPFLLFLFSLCFFSLFILCVSQPKMSCGVVLFGHMT